MLRPSLWDGFPSRIIRDFISFGIQYLKNPFFQKKIDFIFLKNYLAL
jgi:hypothetical protein